MIVIDKKGTADWTKLKEATLILVGAVRNVQTVSCCSFCMTVFFFPMISLQSFQFGISGFLHIFKY